MAEVVARQMAANAGLADSVTFASAGTHANHIGERPDPRAEAALLHRGYTLGRARSRKITRADYQDFDLVLAMDIANLTELKRRCPSEHLGKLRLLLEFAEGIAQAEVPDPYYGNAEGFNRVLDLCEAGVSGLLNHLQPK